MTAVVPDPVSVGARTPVRTATPRHYLMCPPTYFTVEYAINPWMQPGIAVDRRRALGQWDALRRTYLDLGHRVDLLAPMPGLLDMVYAANGATVVNGTVLAARFRHPQREAEAVAHATWFRRAAAHVVEPEFVNEGEGDLLVVGDVILAGHGFRTDPRAHAEAARVRPRGRRWSSSTRATTTSTPRSPCSTPRRSPGCRGVRAGLAGGAQELFPDAVVADAADAAVLGLNAVSDGRHVVLPIRATRLAAAVAERGFVPVPVDLSELLKGGGGPKCCTLEVRS